MKKNHFQFLVSIIGLGVAFFSFAVQTNAESLRVMTYNIKYNEPRDGVNAWPNRKEKVADIIDRADLIGVQEALHGQLKDLEQLLPGFAWCGVGRTDGKEDGEYSAILYRKARLQLLETNTFWLSETPDKSGSMGWDAAFPRIVTWAKFRDIRSKKVFFHFNTHFDHRGEAARINSAKLVVAKAAKIAGKKRLVVTGDFNANTATEIYRILAESQPGKKPFLTDAVTISEKPHTGPVSTFNGFKELVPDARIDHIFVGSGIRVLRNITIEDRPNGLWPSDHLPVFAEISFERKKNVR